ncbi:hypothetical protein BEWA_023470 [Theileria equi strain WA]|uniref:Signal peptide containing protein n=1 Tax=Theileria equi strain WA TaxID=1537102 RepID=L0AW87_THEEQ|nr:hypothetical protein BEWA_023470 [Theileria equi strain WA]AFZ79498.1 hypothetical protein BEWA_023470 [Theileria equi strain WA]|eukprot:XP_004829164.1 hypothetical protein BEWA_023470 [Theileria equi strain WA]
MRFLPSYLVILLIICTVFLLTRRNSGIDTVEIGDDVSGNVRGKSSEQEDKAPCRQPVETRSNNKDRRDQLKRTYQGPETVQSSHLAQQATLEDPLVLAEVSYSSPFDEGSIGGHVDVPPQASPEEPSTNEDSEENELKDNEPEEPKEEASIEALLDLLEHIPEHPQEFEDEDEDPEFHNDDDFWDTPDDYSERQDDTQDEPDGLVIDDEDPEEAYEDDSLKSAPETSTKSRTRSEGVRDTEGQGDSEESEEQSSNEGSLESVDLPKVLSEATKPEHSSGDREESESVPTPAEEHKDNLGGGTDSSQIPLQQVDFVADYRSKVDVALFDLEEAEEDNVKVLKLKARDGAVAKRVKYDGEEIWSGVRRFSTFLCSYAVLYMDGDRPTLAVIKTNGLCNTEPTVYKYYDGTKWQSHDAYWHKNELEALKEKYRPTNPITLDLPNIDVSKINVETKEDNGVTVKEFSPKDDFHISSVMDSCKELWTAGAGQKCFLVEHYEKNNVAILYLETDDGNDTKSKYFEKVGNEWKNIGKELFNEKAKTMIKESVGSTSDTPQDTHLDTCQSFEYHHDDSHIKLVLPQGGVIVTKLLESRSTIWTGKTGEVLEYAKVYLKKDGKPEFVRVWKKGYSGINCLNYTKNILNNWSKFTGNINDKINPLKVATEHKGDFIIDLQNEEDTDECRIFEAELLGVTTRHFYPKPGYYATEVKDGDESLWKASESTDEKCLSCDVYTKDEERILYLSKRKNGKRDDASFEFSDGEWKNITEKEFNDKMNELKVQSSSIPISFTHLRVV